MGNKTSHNLVDCSTEFEQIDGFSDGRLRTRSVCRKNDSRKASSYEFKRNNSMPNRNKRHNISISPAQTNANSYKKGIENNEHFQWNKDSDEMSPYYKLHLLSLNIQWLKEEVDNFDRSRQDLLKRLSMLDRSIFTTKQNIFAKYIVKKGSPVDMEKALKEEPRVQLLEKEIKQLVNRIQFGPDRSSLAGTNLEQPNLDNSTHSSPILTKSVRANSLNVSRCNERDKIEQIRLCYQKMNQEILPELFGQKFAHKSSKKYQIFQDKLTRCKEQVLLISTHDEETLLKSKRIFLEEANAYLRTLDQMVECQNMHKCSECQSD